MTDINTPQDLQVALLNMKEVITVTIEEYLEEPALVLLIELTFYQKLRCLFSRQHKKILVLKFKEIINLLPVGIQVTLHLVL